MEHSIPIVPPRRELYLDPGARYNAGSFQAGNLNSDLGRVPLQEAADVVQQPLAPPVEDESNPAQVALRARNQQNALAIRNMEQNDPDYAFFYKLAGALGFSNVNTMLNPLYIATDSINGDGPIEVEIPPGPQVGYSQKAYIAQAVDPRTIKASYKLAPKAKMAYDSAIAHLQQTCPHLFSYVPVFAKGMTPNILEATENALRNSPAVSTKFCELIRCFFSLANVANPTRYVPQNVRGVNSAELATLTNVFQSQVQWASSALEMQRSGALVLGPEKLVSYTEAVRRMKGQPERMWV